VRLANPDAPSRLIARFQGQTAQAPSQFEHLPYDCTEVCVCPCLCLWLDTMPCCSVTGADHSPLIYLQLLDLHGKQSYLLCDITKAFDRLVSMDTLEGYSTQAMAGRVEVLNMLKESALLHDGKVQQDRGLDIPMRLLPSALALLAQVRRSRLGP
jgi:hypothetical protein